MQIIDKLPRNGLSEGRCQGLGFGFAKKEGETLVMVSPLSCCKDFLSEQVFSEATGKPYAIYGFASSKQDIFPGEGYLVMGVLQKKYGTSFIDYPEMADDIKNMADNYHRLPEFIAWFEEKFKVDGRTKVEKIAENRYLATLPKFWIQFPYRISLCALLLRCAQRWDGKMDRMEYLKNCPTETGKFDNSTMYVTLVNINKMLNGNIPEQDMLTPTGSGSWAIPFNPHNKGIYGYQFPT